MQFGSDWLSRNGNISNCIQTKTGMIHLGYAILNKKMQAMLALYKKIDGFHCKNDVVTVTTKK